MRITQPSAESDYGRTIVMAITDDIRKAATDPTPLYFLA